jgi:hypothetical protein
LSFSHYIWNGNASREIMLKISHTGRRNSHGLRSRAFPVLYKLALGNDDEQGDTHWKTVVSAEPHVVRFIEDQINNLHPRSTHLSAECYRQERKDRRGYKRTEYYAVNLKYDKRGE